MAHKKVKFSHRSYMQPTPKNLRRLGDGLLGVSLFITGTAIAQDADAAYIALIIGGVGKFLTNFFKEE